MQRILSVCCIGLTVYTLHGAYGIWEKNEVFDQTLAHQARALEVFRLKNSAASEALAINFFAYSCESNKYAMDESEKIVSILDSVRAAFLSSSHSPAKSIQQLAVWRDSLLKHLPAQFHKFLQNDHLFSEQQLFEKLSGKAYEVWLNSLCLKMTHIGFQALQWLEKKSLGDNIICWDPYFASMIYQPINPIPGDTVKFEVTFGKFDSSLGYGLSMQLNDQSITEFKQGVAKTKLTFNKPGRHTIKLSGKVESRSGDTLKVTDKVYELNVR